MPFMPIRLISCLFCTVLLCLPITTIAQPEAAGTIKTLKGDVQIVKAGITMKAELGTIVLQSDQIVTGAASTVGITLKDETLMSMGANSKLTLTEYAYDPVSRSGKIDAALIKGVLRFVSGLIAKNSPESIAVRTPISTIGIRGTDFIVESSDEK